MQAGRLRHRIVIQRRVEAINSINERVFHYVDWVPVYAEVLPDRASEFFAGQQLQATENAKIRIRYRSGVEPTMRVKHVVRQSPEIVEYWDIAGVLHIQDRYREMHLMCTKWHAEGFRGGESA